MYKIDTQQKQLKLITEHELSKEEDAPMTIAIHRPVICVSLSLLLSLPIVQKTDKLKTERLNLL